MNELEPLIPYLKEISATLGKHVGKRLGDVLKHFGTDITKYPKRMIERKDAEATAKSEARIALIQTVTQNVAENPNLDPEFVKHVLAQGLRWTFEEVVNFNKIVGDTTESLLNNPPEDDVNSDQPTEDISKDWLNEFRGIACKKSSEDAQNLFSKVLAGEIRKPGSFSLRALTTLSDMDQNVAMIFKAFCSLCFVKLDDPNQYLTSRSYFNIQDVRMPILNGGVTDDSTGTPMNPSLLVKFTDRSEAIYKEYGFDFSEFQLLKEYSLIDDSSLIRYDHFWYNNECWGFLPNNQMPLFVSGSQAINIAGYALTSVGKELYRITKLDTPPQYFEKITEFLQDFYSETLYKFPKHTETSPEESTDQNTINS